MKTSPVLSVAIPGSAAFLKSIGQRLPWSGLGVVLAVLLAATTGWGAHPWFSSHRSGNQSRPVNLRQFSALQDIQGVKGPATITNGIFNLVITLYNDPKGDNDGNTQGKIGSEEQDVYEYIIQYFADGVYEATEGKHSLGTVRLYRNGGQPDADVKWMQSGGPETHGQLNTSGKAGFIEMYDVFGASVFTNPLNFDVGGYCLAHEWGHYAYGLSDEYNILAGGAWVNLAETNKVKPSIMNDQWNARNRDYKWLNFSIPWQGHTLDADFIPYENRRQSAHHQQYEQSCWETLVSDPTNDPLNTRLQIGYRNKDGMRVHYPELATVAPAGTNPPRVDLSSTDSLARLPSRQNLDIIWMSSNLVLELIIDCSGSMAESIGFANRYEYAKVAAKALLDQAPTGTAVGIMSFATTTSVHSAVMVISNEAVRAQLKAAVENIPQPYLDGQTAMGEAAALGLSQLLAFTGSNIVRAAFIITDGEYNYGRDPAEVIPDYLNANVPILGVVIGELTDYIQVMAETTGGRCYLSSDGHLASLDKALRVALTLATARQLLGQDQYVYDNFENGLRGTGGGRAGTAKDYSIPIQVDSTLNDLKVSVVFSNAVTVSLQRPDGVACPAALTNRFGPETQLFYQVSAPDIGEWTLAGTMESNAFLSYTVDAGMKSLTYHLKAWSLPSPGVTYLHFPYPFEIYAYLESGRAIDGAVVTAHIKSQYSETNIALSSIGSGYYLGVGPGAIWADFEVTVRADNSAGTAVMTSAGNKPSSLPDGSLAEPEPDVPIVENFIRYDTYAIEVVGCADNEDPPRAPINVSATAGIFTDCVRLHWYDMNLNFFHDAQYFEIWRSTDPQLAGAVKVASVAYPNAQYFDTNVTPGTIYYFGVRAINPIHASSFAATCMGYAAGAAASSPWTPLAADFDGDQKADPTLYHPVTGAWKVWLSGSGYAPLTTAEGFLGSKDYDPVAADFDGDGRADPAACYRPNGDWIVRLSSQSYAAIVFPGLMGNSSWVALAGDWDGDRRADPTLFCDATGELWARLSSASYASFQDRLFYAGAGLSPLAGDFDGDRRDDPTICQVPTGYWEIHLTSGTYQGVPIAQFWGLLATAGWLPVVADFDGDGLGDLGVYNISSGEWRICLSASGYAMVSAVLR